MSSYALGITKRQRYIKPTEYVPAGATISYSGIYTNLIFASTGTYAVTFPYPLSTTTVNVCVVGAGGSSGGDDSAQGQNSGGGAGAIITGTMTMNYGTTYYIAVGGGGGAPAFNSGTAAGGAGGWNGGGSGSTGGSIGSSGGGGSGGGWSGIYTGTNNYLVIAGGGAGGAGALPYVTPPFGAFGGGYQPSGANGTSTSGGTGLALGGFDAGGNAGGGGGYYGGKAAVYHTVTYDVTKSAGGGGNYFAGITTSTVTTGTGGLYGTGAAAIGGTSNINFFGITGTYGSGGNSVVNGSSPGATGTVILRYIDYYSNQADLEYDPYISTTSLLLSDRSSLTSTATNNTFLDSSYNNNSLTISGTPSQGTFSPYGPNWSVFFDGSSNLTVAPGVSVATFGTGAFTVETWLYVSTTSTNQGIVYAQQGTGAFNILLTSGGLMWGIYGNPSYTVLAAASVPLYQWFHFAASRVSTAANQSFGYINGSLVLTTTDANNYTVTGMLIGYDGLSSRLTNGYISNLRFINGRALYTGSSFTVSTGPLPVVSNTTLLACASNRFLDVSGTTSTIALTGTPTIQRFSPLKPLGAYNPLVLSGGAYFNGTSDYLAVGTTNNLTLVADFTLEAWVYPNTLSGVRSIFTIGSETTSRILFFLTATDGFVKWDVLSVYNGVTSVGVKINSWNHIVYSRIGTTVYIFLNGVLSSTTNNVTGTLGNATQYTVGSNGARTAEFFSGYISNLRLVRGTAVYSTTTSFTPPLAPVRPINTSTSTSLLLNFANLGILDQTGINSISTINSAALSTTVKKRDVYRSMYFNGSTDYLSVQTTNAGDFGTGDFTVEFWMNATAAGTFVAVVGTQSIAGSATAGMWRISNRLSSANGIYFSYTTGSAFTDLTFSTTNYNNGAWHHVAACRASGTLRMFVDGVSVGTPTAVSQSLTSGQKVYVGFQAQDSQYYTGYLDNLRITKGYARYTTSFTPKNTPIR